MISVKMGDEDAVNVKQAYAEMLHWNQGWCPAIQKEPAIIRLNENTGLESAAASKGISAAEKFYLNFLQF